jgi:hypothetical protein
MRRILAGGGVFAGVFSDEGRFVCGDVELADWK